MTVWSVYNNACMGAEVRQLSWSIGQDGPLDRTVFLKFTLRNSGSVPWDSTYAGLWLDVSTMNYFGTVGQPFNDVVGCDTTRSVGYAYSTRSLYPDGGAPPAIGVAVLRGPSVPTAAGGSRLLGMTGFHRFLGFPFDEGFPYVSQAYDVLRRRGADGSPTFDVPGDPVTGSGLIDRNTGYGGRQILVSTGPFHMLPGEEQTLEFALVAGRGSNRLASITNLRESLDQLRLGMPGQPNHPPSLAIGNHSLVAHEGARMTVDVHGEDVDGDVIAMSAAVLPEGATFTDNGSGSGRFQWTPGFDQAGSHVAAFVVRDALGAADSDSIQIEVRNVNQPPIARSGGPYYGAAGTAVEFNGAATGDPDGDPVLSTWSFGDGYSAPGPAATHIYASPGTYEVVLLAYDQSLGDHDTTTATIGTPIEARAFVSGRDGPLQLASPAPTVTLSLEIEGGGVTLSDLQPASFVLESQGTGTVSSINAVDAETRVGGDLDGNGTPELTLVFRKQDLRALFGNMPEGRTETSATLTGVAAKGVVFAASVELTIETTHKPLAVLLAPNPINPEGMLTFTTTRPGPVQVTLYDVRGRLVRKLFESSAAPAGYHDVRIDGRDSGGRTVPTGLYFYRIQALEGSVSGRITILK